MPLILQPSLDEHSREQIEDHVRQVQMRRMAAAVVYAQGQAEKVDAQSDKMARQLASQFDMLGKEISQLDKLIVKVEARLVKVAELQHEHGQLMDYGPE